MGKGGCSSPTDLSEIVHAVELAHGLLQRFASGARRRLTPTETVDLGAELVGLAPLLRHSVGSNVELRVEAERTPLVVRFDAGQLLRVLLNLVSNAADAIGDQEGAIDIVARREVWQGRTYATVYVTDTGCGMDAETLARAFEPFFTTKGPGKGSGLRLTAVRNVVEQAGGQVDCTSTPGRGTTFLVRLPVVAEERPMAEGVAP